jgi:hypothetical protein
MTDPLAVLPALAAGILVFCVVLAVSGVRLGATDAPTEAEPEPIKPPVPQSGLLFDDGQVYQGLRTFDGSAAVPLHHFARRTD